MPETATETEVVEKPAAKSDPPADTGGKVEDVKEKTADIEEQVSNETFWDRLGIPNEEEKKPEADTDKPKEGKKEPKARGDEVKKEEAEKKPEAEPEKKVVEEPKARELDPDRLAEIVSSSAARAAADAVSRNREHTSDKPDAAKPKERSPEDIAEIVDSLPDDIQDDAEVYAEMERLFPEKHGKLLDEVSEFSTKREKYRKRWERENTDKEWDPDDPDHDEFFSSNEPEWSKQDFRKAKKSLEVNRTQKIYEEAEKRVMQKIQPKLEQVERHKKESDLAPELQKAGDAMKLGMVHQINPEYIKLLEEEGGVDKVSKSDPQLVKVITKVSREFEPRLNAAMRIIRGVEAFDMNNVEHKWLMDTLNDSEKYYAALPLKKRLDDQDRMFVPRSQYMTMGDSERAKHWTFSGDQILGIVGILASDKATNLYKEFVNDVEEFNKARGSSSKEDTKTDQGNKEQDESKLPPKRALQVSPSVSPGPSISKKADSSKDAEGGWKEKFGFGA